ncbi:Rieske (2Fe-2S) protein [Millisia brevis]|uniref:Rieske (2Fe-2S) protein n=1 Tax=Millisia brevis TaxID=264148 RepID=UPI000831D504|nr:Rieske (2Fe-2S) protein [Millisia brevis]
MTSVSSEVAVGVAGDLLPGEGRAYAVANTQIAVFRMTDGSLRATDAVCPHKGGPLADGQFDLGRGQAGTGASDLGQVVCPLHQYAFRFADGECSSAGIGAVRVYRVEDRGGEIVVWL